MIKKTILLLALLVSVALNLTAAGTWRTLPLFNGTYSDVVETSEKLYFVSNGGLFSYDKKSQEYYSYTYTNKLSDNLVVGLAYDPQHKFVVAAYKSCNLDVIYEDGRVVNLPEIKIATSNQVPEINSINIANGYICIATSFGYVLYDTDTLTVKESRNFNSNVMAVTVWRNHIVINAGYPWDAGATLVAPFNSTHMNLSDFMQLRATTRATRYQVIGDQLYYIYQYGRDYKNGTEFYYTNNIIYRFDNVSLEGTLSATSTEIVAKADYFHWMNYVEGNFTIQTKTQIIEIDTDGNIGSKFTVPTDFRSSLLIGKGDFKNTWVLAKEGIGEFNFSGSTPTMLSDYFRPEGAVCQRVMYITQSADGERTYITNGGKVRVRTCGSNNVEGTKNMQTTDVLEHGELRDVTYYGTLTNGKARSGEGLVREDPLDKSKYYISSRFGGLIVIKDGECEHVFDGTNSPIQQPWGPTVWTFFFDRWNNLVLTNSLNTGVNTSTILVLPYEKLKNPKTVTKSDWKYYNTSHFSDNFAFDFENWVTGTHHSDIMVFTSSRFGAGLLFVDTQGRADWDLSRNIWLNAFTDQDGNKISPPYTIMACEDHDGAIWVATEEGVYAIDDPTQVFDPNMRVNHLKVPRNDGSGFADYLLAGEQVNWISVDPANRKWIATQNSGLYLVSPKGDAILEHFTEENSPLPTNTVNVVEAGTNDNSVVVGTNMGPLVYYSDASPAAESYDDVYAYPNPVRPDYTGWITVTGLMDNSLVKITDAAGNLVSQGTSNGGMYVWDGCNLGGERARAGVYFVMASENTSGSNFATVTKIVVIN